MKRKAEILIGIGVGIMGAILFHNWLDKIAFFLGAYLIYRGTLELIKEQIQK
jgi:divalent metal cation (Fe/Co/Zn/Cd) transporter